MKSQWIARALAGFAMLAVAGLAAPALAANTYLEFHPGMPGTCTDPAGHVASWIQVTSSTFSLPIKLPKGQTAPAGAPPVDSSLTVTGIDNADSATLIQDAVNGVTLKCVQLIIETPATGMGALTGTNKPTELYRFTNAYVTAVTPTTSGKIATTTFAFNYQKASQLHEKVTATGESWVSSP